MPAVNITLTSCPYPLTPVLAVKENVLLDTKRKRH